MPFALSKYDTSSSSSSLLQRDSINRLSSSLASKLSIAQRIARFLEITSLGSLFAGSVLATIVLCINSIIGWIPGVLIVVVMTLAFLVLFSTLSNMALPAVTQSLEGQVKRLAHENEKHVESRKVLGIENKKIQESNKQLEKHISSLDSIGKALADLESCLDLQKADLKLCIKNFGDQLSQFSGWDSCMAKSLESFLQKHSSTQDVQVLKEEVSKLESLISEQMRTFRLLRQQTEVQEQSLVALRAQEEAMKSSVQELLAAIESLKETRLGMETSLNMLLTRIQEQFVRS